MQRITANLSDDAHSTLERLAEGTEKTASQILREALKLRELAEEARKNGGRVVFESDGESTTVLLSP